MQQIAYLRFPALCALAVSVFWSTACGGRFQTIREVADDDVELTGGASGSGASGAGKPGSKGGTSGVAGANNASGATSVGGSGCLAPCPAPSCGPSRMPAMVPGQCCLVCVDDPAACSKGSAAYEMDVTAFAEKGSYGCSSDQECVVVVTSNRCLPGCSYDWLWYGAAEYFSSSASFSAEMNCSACTPALGLPCAAPAFKPKCVEGRCLLPGLN